MDGLELGSTEPVNSGRRARTWVPSRHTHLATIPKSLVDCKEYGRSYYHSVHLTDSLIQ